MMSIEWWMAAVIAGLVVALVAAVPYEVWQRRRRARLDALSDMAHRVLGEWEARTVQCSHCDGSGRVPRTEQQGAA